MLQRTAARLACAVCTGLMGTTYAANAEEPLMNALFTDHVVLQRDRPIDVWPVQDPVRKSRSALGRDAPHAQADAAVAGPSRMPELPAGGPHTLTARTATQVQNAEDCCG